VTPALPTEPVKAKRKPGEGQPRKKRKSAVYDAEGHEVFITLMCLKCRQMKPLMMFGLRKMADGAIRNQPWCRGCRSGASANKPKAPTAEVESAAPQVSAPVDAQSDAAAESPVESPAESIVTQEIVTETSTEASTEASIEVQAPEAPVDQPAAS
jgi:hypothetical protein